jgi:hypothetical protein
MNRLVVAGSLCVVAMLAGCGGSGRLSASGYKAKLAALNKEVDTAETHAQAAATRAQSVAQIRAALTQVAVAQDRVGDAVEKLKPPKDAESANKLLARGAHDIASETRAVLPALASVKTPRQALALPSATTGKRAKGCPRARSGGCGTEEVGLLRLVVVGALPHVHRSTPPRVAGVGVAVCWNRDSEPARSRARIDRVQP